jgi:hypothetical protein
MPMRYQHKPVGLLHVYGNNRVRKRFLPNASIDQRVDEKAVACEVDAYSSLKPVSGYSIQAKPYLQRLRSGVGRVASRRFER